jgi:putative spermidine/putrescine transport system ATP-binding protein
VTKRYGDRKVVDRVSVGVLEGKVLAPARRERVRQDHDAQTYRRVGAPGRGRGLDSGRHSRALISRPRLLLLDEPVSSLDTNLKAKLLAEFAELQRMLRVTTVYVTHDEAEVAELAHRIAVMHEGRIEQV